MRTVSIAGTDIAPGAICLGTNMFGTALDEAAASGILEAFLAAGGTLIDTAHSYGDWVPGIPGAASERTLGALLERRPRASYLIATKGCEFDYRAGDYALRVTRRHFAEDLEASLRNLRVERIDLYWLHRDDPSRPVSVIVDALIAEQSKGRIRHFGCSNWSPPRIAEAQRYAASLGHRGFAACQPMWGLARPDPEAMQRFAPGGYYEDGYRELHAGGLAMIPYSGQSRGYFSKLDRGAALAPDIAALYDSATNRRKLPVLRELARRHGCDVNAVVLAYLCSQPLPTIPIIGATSAAQLRDSLAALDVRLDTDELQRLRDA
jgi:aryl-alcohol dehydrogenase-like predicted oxidoreductase